MIKKVVLMAALVALPLLAAPEKASAHGGIGFGYGYGVPAYGLSTSRYSVRSIPYASPYRSYSRSYSRYAAPINPYCPRTRGVGYGYGAPISPYRSGYRGGGVGLYFGF